MNISDAERLFGLCDDYTLSDIRASYKNLAKQYHPDQNGNSQASIYFMRQINEAYALLEYETVESEMAPQRLRAKNDALYAIACRLISDDNILSLEKAIPILECDLIGWKDSASLFEESRKRLAQLVGKQSEEFSS